MCHSNLEHLHCFGVLFIQPNKVDFIPPRLYRIIMDYYALFFKNQQVAVDFIVGAVYSAD